MKTKKYRWKKRLFILSKALESSTEISACACVCVCVPASSWPTLCVCAHRSSGPSCSPPGWWGHWDRSASPQASTSQGYFLSQGDEEEGREDVSWTSGDRGRRWEGIIKSDRQCRGMMQNSSHDEALALQPAPGKNVFTAPILVVFSFF